MSRLYEPNISIYDNAPSIEQRVAEALIAQVQTKPRSVLTLTAGRTMRNIYALLIAAYKASRVDFSQVSIFNLDEYWPIEQNHPASYASYMARNFYDFVNVPESGRYIPNGQAASAAGEAARYEKLLDAVKVDLAVITLGTGKSCHVAFNEAGSGRSSRVRYVELTPESRRYNLPFFADPSSMPLGGITQGIGNILEAKRLIFIATGEHKAWGVRRCLEGPVSSEAPASFIREHPSVDACLDVAAASLLSNARGF